MNTGPNTHQAAQLYYQRGARVLPGRPPGPEVLAVPYFLISGRICLVVLALTGFRRQTIQETTIECT